MDILFIGSPVTLLTRVISVSAGGQEFARGPGESASKPGSELDFDPLLPFATM